METEPSIGTNPFITSVGDQTRAERDGNKNPIKSAQTTMTNVGDQTRAGARWKPGDDDSFDDDFDMESEIRLALSAMETLLALDRALDSVPSEIRLALSAMETGVGGEAGGNRNNGGRRRSDSR